MKRINTYLFTLSLKYIFFNLIIISIFIFFLNLIEISRIVEINDSKLSTYVYLSILKFPSILNEILPFVTIVATSFLFRYLINNNELISMRNIGYSIFDIFLPIGLSVFFIGIIFLIFLNPISANFEHNYEKTINKKDQSLYSIKISNNEMWIKNKINENSSSFINIENIDLKDMTSKNINILLINNNFNQFIEAKKGLFENNKLLLNEVKLYDVNKEELRQVQDYSLGINFNKDNIINSITNYRLVPYYNYLNHTKTLKKFNLYSPEIGLFYLSEVLKPIFIVMLSFIIVGFSGKFKRNESFFKILFISILIGFLIFFLKEIITKLTISLSVNFIVSYIIIFFIPFLIGLYQVIKIEND